VPQENPSRARLTAYWILTGLLAVEMTTGGTWDLLRTHYVRALMDQLSYPHYMLTILGIWKLLAVVAILLPGFPRLKEWAYAGMFFDLTGAAASHAIRYDGPRQIVVTLTLALLVMASWALRPASRRLASP
jgi:uncharacterized membrane protein YphA (DoxX/SURF4 family)